MKVQNQKERLGSCELVVFHAPLMSIISMYIDYQVWIKEHILVHYKVTFIALHFGLLKIS